MGQYQTGTASVTNASAVVTGSGTLWDTYAAVGDTFKITGVAAIYTIASVDSDTQITLTEAWAGDTAANSTYMICVDFTPYLSIPEIWAGDKDWPFHLTTGLRMIDEYCNRTLQAEVLTKTDDYTVATSDFGKSLRMNSSGDKTFTLPSVGSDEDGAQIQFLKIGSGKLTIDAADSDYIDDSAAGGTIYSTTANATITLQYCHATTRWYVMGALGTWTTT